MLVAGVVMVATMVCLAASKRIECPSQCRCYLDAEGYSTAHCSPTAFAAPRSKHLYPGIDNLDIKPFRRGHPVKLTRAMFQSFKNLQILNLSNSSIAYVPEGTFTGLRSVFDVDLSHNSISRLGSGVLKGLPKLNTLILRGNPIDPPYCALLSDSLRELDLAHCDIEALPPQFFVGVPGLTHLNLEGNRLKTFAGLPSGLRFINLAENEIADVPTHSLSIMQSLRNVDLSGNPFNCTCNLLVMQDWLSGRGVMMGNDVVCAAPPAYYGRNLRKIDEDELCEYEGRRRGSINEIQRSPLNRDRPKVIALSHSALYGDEGFMGDQPIAGDAEVLHSNKETQKYGTHMEIVEGEEGSGDESSLPDWSSESTEATTPRDKSLETTDFTFAASSESLNNEITSVEATSPMTPTEESGEEVEGSGELPSTTSEQVPIILESDDETEPGVVTEPPTTEASSTEPVVVVLPEHIESEPTSTSTEVPVPSQAPPSEPPHASSTSEIPIPEVTSPKTTTTEHIQTVYMREEFAVPSNDPPESVEDVSTEASRTNATIVTGATQSSLYQTAGTYLLVAAIAVPILILILMAMFRRRSPRKGVLRLPADAEANTGTELQDMDTLLPKDGENAVKLVAASKLNGSAHPSDSKCAEELARLEPEVDAGDGGSPRVTPPASPAASPPPSPRENGSKVVRTKAKLTVLPDSVPKTPVFIHKPFTD